MAGRLSILEEVYSGKRHCLVPISREGRVSLSLCRALVEAEQDSGSIFGLLCFVRLKVS